MKRFATEEENKTNINVCVCARWIEQGR